MLVKYAEELYSYQKILKFKSKLPKEFLDFDLVVLPLGKHFQKCPRH